jgi:hypothetical protein
MKLNKYTLPINTLTSIIEINKIKSDHFIKTIDGRGDIIFKHRDPICDFYFKINLQDSSKKGDSIHLQWKPTSPKVVEEHSAFSSPNEIKQYITNWELLLKQYDELTLDDDEIINEFQTNYFNQFEIIDDEYSKRPLADYQILYLEEYLSNIVVKIDDFKNEYNREIIQEIIDDSSALRLQLTSFTKSEVAKRISKIWSKMRKAGVEVMKELLGEIRKEVIATITKHALDGIPHVISKLLH